jgi:beta-lactamase class A
MHTKRYQLIMSKFGILFFCVLFLFPVKGVSGEYESPKTISDEGLRHLYKNIVNYSSLTDGTVGVGIIHLETGRELYYNGEERFPMASVVKIPVAVQLMTLIDQHKLSLDTMITITENDYSPGSGSIKYRFPPDSSLSIRYLLEQMLTVSDNSATDIIFRTVGGSSAIKKHMREIGIDNMTIDRPIFMVLGNCWGINCLKEDEPVSLEEMERLRAKVAKAELIKARRNYLTDLRDTSTPEAMAKLLQKIWNGDILSDENSALLLDIMSKSKGKRRIKGLLPTGTKVYHKTGTIRGGLSDIGIIELPNDAGHVIVVIFVKGGRKPIYMTENTMAKIAKDAFDYFSQN